MLISLIYTESTILRKRFKKAKGKVNKIPLNVLRKPKGQRRTRPQVSKELISIKTSFHEYQNLKDTPSVHKEADNSAQYDGIDNTSYHHDDSLPAYQSYVKRKIKAAERWEEVRAGIQKIILHKHSLDKAVCFNCKQSSAVIRCHQCSPYLYCMDCSNQFHHNKNFHHCPEIWKVHICMLCD